MIVGFEQNLLAMQLNRFSRVPLASPAVARFCERSLSFLSFSLIEEEYQKKIKTFCCCLHPAWTTSQIGLEFSLLNQQNWGDFHYLVNIKEFYQNIEFEDSSWLIMADLFNKWRTTDFLGKNDIGRTILEFDIGSSLVWPPKPNICLLFTPPSRRSLAAIANTLPPSRKKKYILATINQFLSKGWTVDGIGLMLARSDSLRILFRFAGSMDSLTEFFSELGLYRVVEVLLDIFAPFPICPFLFEIDLNENGMISSRVGVDIPPRNDLFSVESILEKFHRKNLVNSNKKNSLLSWIGVDRQLDPLYYPENGSIVRDIHHFKLICSPHQDLSVKAYLSSRYIAKNPVYRRNG